MFLYYPHPIEQGGRMLLVTLLYDLFYGHTILGLPNGRREYRSPSLSFLMNIVSETYFASNLPIISTINFKLMYDDPKRHSLTFQSYVQLTMTQLHVKKPSSPEVQLKVMTRPF